MTTAPAFQVITCSSYFKFWEVPS